MKGKDRIYEQELMDLGSAYYTQEEYDNCLKQLDRIGRFLGGDRASFHAFKKIKGKVNSILDVGCGGGFLTLRLAQCYPDAKIVGVDLCEEAIHYAKNLQNRWKPVPKDLSFDVTAQQLIYPAQSFDIVTSTLMCHHLSDEQIIAFLKTAYFIAKRAIILNDLHRHFLAYYSFKTIAPFFDKNKLIMNDGPLSVLRAFKRSDWIKFLHAASIPLEKCTITWHFAFRWVVTIQKEL